jgi:hypothetical protein
MRLGNFKVGVPAMLAAWSLVVCCGLAASVPQAAAQSFGGVSVTDLEAERDSFFKSADMDGDYALSSEEQLSAIGTRNAELFECSDSDGDGVCSYAEFLDSGQQVFDELDVNGDGHLSPDELH